MVTRDTIVIILGDARNNRNDSGIEYLRKIKERARHVSWLNPDSMDIWDAGDSIIGKYAKSVDRVYKATTFTDLVKFLDDREISV